MENQEVVFIKEETGMNETRKPKTGLILGILGGVAAGAAALVGWSLHKKHKEEKYEEVDLDCQNLWEADLESDEE